MWNLWSKKNRRGGSYTLWKVKPKTCYHLTRQSILYIFVKHGLRLIHLGQYLVTDYLPLFHVKKNFNVLVKFFKWKRKIIIILF